MLVDQNDQNAINLLVSDCLLSITRALSKVNLKDSQALAIYDRLNEISQTEQKNILQITLEQDDLEVSPRLAALFLLLHLYNWFSGGRQAFYQLGVLIGDLWPESVAPEGGLEAQIVAVSLLAMEGLASIEKVDDLTGAPANQAATGLSHLARLLHASGLWQVGEYVDDKVFGSANLSSNYDAMTTLAWTLVGGMIMGLAYDLYLRAMPKRRQAVLGFIHLYEVQEWR